MEAISTELVAYIERNTCDQVESELWRRLHTGRITSSLFGAIFKSQQQVTSLVQRILQKEFVLCSFYTYDFKVIQLIINSLSTVCTD